MARYIETGDEQRAQARADREQEFQDWEAAVDRRIRQRLGGIGASDLADQPYRDMFDDGLDPAEAAEFVLENEGLL